ncbi:MAG: AtpZ/AtpI family protein [Myxococcales bacterium]|nr:AtpZ/AtpI family protein [Myxococcales bacterium]
MARKRPERAQWFELAEAASVGIEMAVAVAIGHFGGIWLEKNVTHWAPYTRWIGVGVGLGAAIMAIVRTAQTFQRKLAMEEAAKAAEVEAAKAEAEDLTGAPAKPRQGAARPPTAADKGDRGDA